MSHLAVYSLGAAATSPNKLVKLRSKHSSRFLRDANRPLVPPHNYSMCQTQSPFIQAFAQSLDATITSLLTPSLSQTASAPSPSPSPSQFFHIVVLFFLCLFPSLFVCCHLCLFTCVFLSAPAGTRLKIPVLVCRCNSSSGIRNVASADWHPFPPTAGVFW